MSRKRRSPQSERQERAIDELVAEIKAVNDRSKFPPSAWDKEQLLAEKSRLQSELLREYGERFELFEEVRGTIGILGIEDDRDACHARIERLDPDVRAWVLARLNGR